MKKPGYALYGAMLAVSAVLLMLQSMAAAQELGPKHEGRAVRDYRGQEDGGFGLKNPNPVVTAYPSTVYPIARNRGRNWQSFSSAHQPEIPGSLGRLIGFFRGRSGRAPSGYYLNVSGKVHLVYGKRVPAIGCLWGF